MEQSLVRQTVFADGKKEAIAITFEKLEAKRLAGFGGELFGSGNFVIISLGNGRIRLVTSRRRNTLILVIDMGGSSQSFLK